jgi:hypothetical protein
MSRENVQIVRSLFEPFEGSNIAAIDWGVDVIREALGQAYSPDVELRTLASGLGSGVGEFYRGADGLVRNPRLDLVGTAAHQLGQEGGGFSANPAAAMAAAGSEKKRA